MNASIKTSLISRRDIFAILSKCITKSIYDKYTAQGDFEKIFISDTKPEFSSHNVYTYDDKLLSRDGYHHAGFNSDKPTAWDKIFWHLRHVEQPYNYVWVVEDDCYLNKKKFSNLIEQYVDDPADILHFSWSVDRSAGDSWYHFRDIYNKYFPSKYQSGSLNVFTRLSNNLVDKVLEFQQKHSCFVFQEIMISSIADMNKLTRRQVVNREVKCGARSLAQKITTNRDKYTVLHPIKNWDDQ